MCQYNLEDIDGWHDFEVGNVNVYYGMSRKIRSCELQKNDKEI